MTSDRPRRTATGVAGGRLTPRRNETGASPRGGGSKPASGGQTTDETADPASTADANATPSGRSAAEGEGRVTIATPTGRGRSARADDDGPDSTARTARSRGGRSSRDRSTAVGGDGQTFGGESTRKESAAVGGDGRGGGRSAALAVEGVLAAERALGAGSRYGWLRGPGAPLTWLLLFFPLWWMLGLGGLIFFIAAVPMAIALARRDRVEVPPGFGIWLVFCLVVVVSSVAIGLTPDGTVAGSWVGRIPGVAFRLVGYASATVICLYAVNLSESDFPRRRLVKLLAATGVITVVGGLVGTFAGHWEFTSPLEALLPKSLASNQFVQSLVHPQAAQVMDFLGYDTPRPAAPWGYTNTWGNMLAIAAPWIAVAVVGYRTSPRLRFAAIAILTVALIPAVYSMNRGLWLNLAVAGVFVAFRFLASGRWLPVVTLAVTVVVALAAVLVTPLGQVVAARFANGHSDDGRGYSTMKALEALPESPVLGFGSTRQTVGSGDSIAVGPTPECPRCGGRTLGGNGQLWQTLFAHGLTGALAYVGFFVAVMWRFRRDHSAIGIVASVTMLLSLTSMFYYNALVAPLVITLLCYALLWRNERDRAVEGTI